MTSGLRTKRTNKVKIRPIVIFQEKSREKGVRWIARD
jgi:hypothetical protein